MGRMRAILVVACLLLVQWGVQSGDIEDMEDLQREILAQNQELRDLRAKVAQESAYDLATADELTSLRKNATVTLGGTVNTRYSYQRGELKSELALPFGGPYTPTGDKRKRESYKGGDLAITDAKVEMKIDVTEHFDAFLKLDFHDGMKGANVSGIAENYWIRWKNICNSGFGLLVGRDALKFGDDQPIGVLDGWNKAAGGARDHMTQRSNYGNWDFTRGNGMFAHGSLVPVHTTYDWTRTTQLNPYWESWDGRLRVDVSLIQAVDRLTGFSIPDYDTGVPPVARPRYRSINYGVGSATARVQWKPVEGLKLTASAMNLYAKRPFANGFWSPTGYGNWFRVYGVDSATANTSVNLAVQWRPRFLPRLNAWAQWTHGWNEAWVRDMDSDSANAGLSFDLTDNWTLFAQGDYLRTRNSQSDLWHKATGWALYAGAVFTLPYGVNFEAGWRHERIDYRGRTLGKHTQYSGDTVYAHLGFTY